MRTTNLDGCELCLLPLKILTVDTPDLTMRVALVLVICNLASSFAFAPISHTFQRNVAVKGYLDDLSNELYAPNQNPDLNDSREETNLSKEDVDRFGVGNWDSFVDFNEFDGGDGQMGVAGDGNKVSGSLLFNPRNPGSYTHKNDRVSKSSEETFSHSSPNRRQ